MKALSFGNYKRGISTLEILIAFAVLTLSMSAVILVVFSNQSVAANTQTSVEALSHAQAGLEAARALSRQSYAAVQSVASTSDDIYQKALGIVDITQCKKQATDTVSWQQGARVLTIALSTYLTDIQGALALGGDCDVNPPAGAWDPPVLYASSNVDLGKPTSIDVLNKIVYLGGTKSPFLFIADARGAISGQSSGLFVAFANSFNNNGKTIDQINDIDVFEDTEGKVYAVVAMASTTAQLVVLDVSDPLNPVVAKNSSNVPAKRTLAGVDPAGSFPQGWRVYYYDKKVYITTRETSGPEFHIFNVSDPTNPTEIGSGKKLTGCTPPNGTTVNDMVVRGGIAYLAASKEDCEVMLYDVSVPAAPVYLANASVELTGSENALSLALMGTRLYVGRQKTAGGRELYVLDAGNPLTAANDLPAIGPADPGKEMGIDITDIRVSGNYMFLATYGNNSSGFKVWDISNPASIQDIHTSFTIGNKPVSMDAEGDFVYAASEATPNLQIFHSP